MHSVVISRRGNGDGVLQGGADDLGRVDHAGVEHVAVLVVEGVVAVVAFPCSCGCCWRRPHHRACRRSRRSCGWASRRTSLTSSHAECFVPFELYPTERLGTAQQSNPAAGDDSFFDGRPRGMQGVVDEVAFRSFISVSVAAPTLIWRRRRRAWRAVPAASRGRSRCRLLSISARI